MKKKEQTQGYKMRQIISSMADTLIVTGTDGRIKTVNKAALDLLGYREEELIGKDASLIFEEEGFFKGALLKDLVKRGSVRNVDMIYTTKGGEKIPVSFTISVMRSEECPVRDGPADECEEFRRKGVQCEKIAGIVGVGRDMRDVKTAIADLEKAKKRLESSESSFRDLIMKNADGIIILDKDGVVRLSNPAAEALIGPKGEYLLDRKIGFSAIKDKAIELDVMNKDKKASTVEMRVAEIEWEGKDAYVASVRDVTERRQAEQLRIEVEEHRKLTQLKDEFVSTVSHELRTPISITREALSLLLDGVPGEINEKQKKLVGTSRDNMDRLTRIINDLLDISKIEAGKIILKKDLINVEEIVKKAVLTFQSLARGKGLGLKVNTLDSGLQIYADKDKIIQVFTNLLFNAVKFTNEGYVEISVQKKEGDVECAVVDTGIGIAQEDIPKIFSKFQQFGRVHGAGAKGTGLGLSIVKGIIEAHQGRVWVESQLGKGSRFAFALPVYTLDTLLKGYVDETIEKIQGTDNSVSLIILSLSEGRGDFKLTGDTLDDILPDMEDILKNTLRGEEGDIVIRCAGKIFIILPKGKRESISASVGRIEVLLEGYLTRKKMKEKIELSFRHATYPDDAKSGQELINKARKKS